MTYPTPQTCIHSTRQVVGLWLILLVGSLAVMWAFDQLSPQLMNYLESSNPRVMYEQARDMKNKGQSDKALSLLDQAIRLNPSNPQYLILKGDILEEQGKTELAMESFTKAQKVGSREWLPNYRLGAALRKANKNQEALPYLKKAALLTDKERWVFDNLGWAAYDTGDYQTAYEAFGKAYSIMPESPVYPLMLGKIDAVQGRWNEALSLYKKSLSLDNAKSETYAAAGDAAVKLGLTGEARQYYQQSLKLNPKQPMVEKALKELSL